MQYVEIHEGCLGMFHLSDEVGVCAHLCVCYHLLLLSLQRCSVSGDLPLSATQLLRLLFDEVCRRTDGQKMECNRINCFMHCEQAHCVNHLGCLNLARFY